MRESAQQSNPSDLINPRLIAVILPDFFKYRTVPGQDHFGASPATSKPAD